MSRDPNHTPTYYTRTPFLKRLPTVLALVASYAVAMVLAHVWWVGVLVFLGMFVLCILVLRFLFRLPLDRLLGYKEFH